MNVHRAICVLVLITFLPLAVGCSKTRVVALGDDPASSGTHSKFASGEAIEVYGYTRTDEGFREWRGYVQAVPPDSLQFTQKREYRKPEGARPFRLALTDLVSLDAREFSPVKTSLVVFTGALIVGVAIAGAIIAASGGFDFGGGYYQ